MFHRPLVLAGLAAAGAAFTPPAHLVDAAKVVPGLQVELKYATTDNFMHRNLYGRLRTCYLQKDAAAMLAVAARHLAGTRPDLRLHAYDCARPRRIQVAMWDVVKGTPQAPYVANPHGPTGSIHNYGCAVDLTLADATGKPVDMGTPYDHFGPEAHIDREAALVAAGKLTAAQVANRRVLRAAMVAAGFQPMREEWWHFNCAGPAETRRKYKVIL